MAFSHLIQAKQRVHLHRIGFPKPTRWRYSTSSKGETEKSSQPNKTEAKKQQRAMAVESFVKRGAQKGKGLANLFMETKNDQVSGELTDAHSYIFSSNRFSKFSAGATGKGDMAQTYPKGLVDCIMGLQGDQLIKKPENNFTSNKTDQISSIGLITGIQSRANLQRFDIKRSQASLNGHPVDRTEEEEPSTSGRKSKSSPDIPLPGSKTDLSNTQVDSSEKGSDQNKMIVRFLPKTAQESDVVAAFMKCGHIMKIELSSVKQSFFKFAYIYFKTREGVENALKQTDLMVKNAHVSVEAASSLEMSNRTSIPKLIGDPDVPATLVKNPTRTVMVKQLTPDISLHHIEEALAFCNSNISGFFLGSSSSVAYVEFETEDGKERALANHSIFVLGKQLSMFRIDMPRTTAVRISNINFPEGLKKVYSICASYGKVKAVVTRNKNTVDVYFKIAEWPNMLKILNGLNGREVNGLRLLAQSAPVFPPEVLCVLWSQLDERRWVKAVVQNLLQKLGEDAGQKSGLTDLAAKFFRD